MVASISSSRSVLQKSMVKQVHSISPRCDVSAWLWQAPCKLCHFDRDALNLNNHYKLSIFHESMAVLTKKTQLR